MAHEKASLGSETYYVFVFRAVRLDYRVKNRESRLLFVVNY